jgi:hypothetical protein
VPQVVSVLSSLSKAQLTMIQLTDTVVPGSLEETTGLTGVPPELPSRT